MSLSGFGPLPVVSSGNDSNVTITLLLDYYNCYNAYHSLDLTEPFTAISFNPLGVVRGRSWWPIVEMRKLRFQQMNYLRLDLVSNV